MTPALVVTIICFLVGMAVQGALFAYYYGRLTMQVDMLKIEVASKASREHLGTVETTVNKLTELFQKFLVDVDVKLDRIRDVDQRDDQRTLDAVAHLEEYMEAVAAWIGERLGSVGRTLDDHERVVRKLAKVNQISYERLPAQGGAASSESSGKHEAIPPPPRPGQAPRPGATGGFRVPTIPGRKSDPRREGE